MRNRCKPGTIMTELFIALTATVLLHLHLRCESYVRTVPTTHYHVRSWHRLAVRSRLVEHNSSAAATSISAGMSTEREYSKL